MATDFPDFTVPIWNRRDWASKELTYKTWGINTGDIAAGGTAAADIYTIPSGKMLFVTDFQAGGTIMGYTQLYIVGSYILATTFFEPYCTEVLSYSTPIPLTVGQVLKYSTDNDDTITGWVYNLIIAWETTASKPSPAKSDDPLDLYKAGEFNQVRIISLDKDEQLFLFSKAKKDRVSYLRIKNLYRPDEKKLASFHLKPEEAEDILSTLPVEPQKVKEVLLKCEKLKQKLMK
jgi:hypothetical protein